MKDKQAKGLLGLGVIISVVILAHAGQTIEATILLAVLLNKEL